MDVSLQLPPEILTDVFEWINVISLDEYSPPSPPDGRQIRALCWPVSQVCKYWRDVALTSSFLWTFLPRVDLGRHHYPPPEERLGALTELISRARNEPLHVSVVCWKDAWTGAQLDVLDLILSLSNQWGSISIDAPAERIKQLFELTQGRISRLESLRLYLLEWHDSEAEAATARQVVLGMFNNAPMLKTVIISGALTATAGWNLNLDTRELENLHVGIGSVIHSIRPTSGFDFSKLTTLEMWDRGISDYSEMADEEVTLAFPALRSLTYQCSDWFDPDERFLLLPVAPLLEQLSITAARGDIATLLVGLHRRCRPRPNRPHPLKSLYLRVGLSYSFDKDYIKVLELFSNLETLDMNFPGVNLLNALSKVDGAQMLVPRLKECSFVFRAYNFDEANTAVKRLAYERCEPSYLLARQKQQLFVLRIYMHYRPELSVTRRERPGFGFKDCLPIGIKPTMLERWYAPGRLLWCNAYTDAVETIRKMLLQGYGEIDIAKFDYRHTLELIERVVKRYKGAELVEFLETNTNISLISAAYFVRTKMPENSKSENSTYRQIVRLLKHVRKDILDKLNSLSFNWIWESSRDKIWIRYITDQNELRADPEKFANAILGITDDLWILDDF